MSKKAWIIFTVVVVGLLVALVVWSKNESVQVDTKNIDASVIQPASESNGNIADHVFGNVDSKIILVEYGDFQCPPCGNAHPVVKTLLEKYSDEMVFIFRNYPIPDSHPNAKAAAAAAEAAGLQDQYWPMYDKIFENQSEWSAASATERNDIFGKYATEIGLDIDKFNSDLSSSNILKKINLDLAIGKQDGVNATPTFKLSGEQLTVDKLEDAIKAKLAN